MENKYFQMLGLLTSHLFTKDQIKVYNYQAISIQIRYNIFYNIKSFERNCFVIHISSRLFIL